MSYLADIMRKGKTNYQRTGQFYAEASEAEFLFSESISKKMEELYSKGVDLVALHKYNKIYNIFKSQNKAIVAVREAPVMLAGQRRD